MEENTNIGQLLRTEREKRGLSFQQIEQETKIRTKFLQALEDEDYDKIPGDVYVKGFLKSYANFLELDGEKMVQLYKKQKGNNPAVPISSYGAPVRNREQGQETASAAARTSHERSNRRREKRGWGIWLIAGVLVLAIAGAGYYFLSYSSNKVPQQSQNEQAGTTDNISVGTGGGDNQGVPQIPDSTPTSKGSNSADTSDQAQADKQNPADSASVKGLQLTLKTLDENCWTEIKADGKIVFSGTISANSQQSWQAQDKLVVTVGNAGSADLILNGQDLGVAGAKGEVKQIPFSVNKAQQQ